MPPALSSYVLFFILAVVLCRICVPGTTLRYRSSLFADKVVKKPRARGPHRLSSTQLLKEALRGLLLLEKKIKQS